MVVAVPGPILLLVSAAQTVGGIWEEPITMARGSSASEHGWGSAVAVIGDQDGDGVSEIVVGDPLYSAPGAPQCGRIQVFRGADGGLLFEFSGTERSMLGWALARAPDQDGDARDDLLVGAPGFAGRDGRAVLLSPSTGRLLLALHDVHLERSRGSGFGAAVCVTSSTTQDYFVIGAPHADYCGLDGGSFSCYGSDGGFISGAYGCTPGAELGSAIAPLPGSAPHTAGFVTRQWRFGTITAQVLIYGNLYGYRHLLLGPDLGSHLATGADWNGDGFPDIAIGAALFHRVHLYDGWTAALLETFEDATSPGFPSALALTEDLDGDGRPELAVGVTGDALTGRNGEVRLFSPGRGHFRTITLAAPRAGGVLAAGSGLDAGGIPGLVAGAGAAGQALTTAGAPVSLVRFRPILHVGTRELSATQGGVLRFTFGFGADFALGHYRLLVSGTGTGPSYYGGLLIPLSPDAHLAATRSGNYPRWILQPEGRLNALGGGQSWANAPPGTIPAGWIGRNFYFAVAGASASGMRSGVSVARAVEIVP